MISFSNGGCLVQDVKELPSLSEFNDLYLDVETTSGSRNEPAFDSFRGHRIAGFAFTVDNHKKSYYVPIRHNHLGNVKMEPALRCLRHLVSKCKRWINHNVKFDAHFCKADGAEFTGEIIDTVTLSKIIDSDRGFGRGGYALDELSRDWLEEDISHQDKRVQSYLKSIKSKDYGDVPIDIMAEYACQDVITNRRLWAYIQRVRHEQTKEIWETEIKFTPVLYDIEQLGMRVVDTELKTKKFVLLHKLLKIEEDIEAMSGSAIRPHVNDDCFELLCIKYGLPVLGRTEKEGNPSFDKRTMMMYAEHPLVLSNPDLVKICKLIAEYRKVQTHVSIFIDPYLELHSDGVLHSSYNQLVRTGRLSCKNPNSQNLDDFAKSLIHVYPGWGFLCFDYSQIEFRFIVHYIKDLAAIAAYIADPDTDFHSWVASEAGIPRKPAKNINFGTAFGAGMRKIMAMLRLVPEFIAEAAAKTDQLILDGRVPYEKREAVLIQLCDDKARMVYDRYHETLPSLKPTSHQAEKAARCRGYVFNHYGRHRHLTLKHAYKAFNSAVQGSAADLVKERMIALAPRYNKRIRDYGLHIFETVHDEVGFTGPVDVTKDPEVRSYILSELETPSRPIRVPIRAEGKWSETTWAECQKIDIVRKHTPVYAPM